MALDLRKGNELLYDAPRDPVFVEVPPLRYLLVNGSGAPIEADYQHAIQALYSMAYRLKYCLQENKNIDFSIMPLETLWWSEEGAAWSTDLSGWRWTALMRIPDAVCEDCYNACWEKAAERSDSPAFSRLRMRDWEEGRAVQVLHVGPWSEEEATVEKLHAFIAEYGGTTRGKHHEVYLSDPKRTKPAHLRTIIRQPIV